MRKTEEQVDRVSRGRETPSGSTVSPGAYAQRQGGIGLKTSNPYIIKFAEQDGPIAEEYRKLRSLLLAMTKRQANRNTIMVTSSESGEGKSLTSVNLALVLAREFNHTVLLVDADLRRPMLPTYLGLEPSLGLSDCLTDGLDVGRALVRTGVPKLSFLSAGKNTDMPAELLSSSRMKELIHEIKHRYHDRYIIIDTPPALIFSETHVISSYVDGVLFVVKEGVALSGVRAALDTLKDSPLLGIVYNNASPQQLTVRYHHYYYQYYNRKRREPAKKTK